MSAWRGKKVVVTGAGGFIGSHLTERLVHAGADVTAFVHYRALGSEGWLRESSVRRDVRIVPGDVTDRDSLAPAFRGASHVFHLAALISIPYSQHAPTSFIRTQIEGTANVMLEAGRAGVTKVLVMSTSEVYGSARTERIDENHPLTPRSPYAATKVGAEKIAETLAWSLGVELSLVRPFNTYGPRQSARAIIPTLIGQALARPEIAVGNLHPTRDFTFVDDTVDGLLAVAALPGTTPTINLGAGREITIERLARAVAASVGRPELAVVTDERRLRQAPLEVDRLRADTSRAQALIGWSPKVELEEGLQRTIEWIRANPRSVEAENYVY